MFRRAHHRRRSRRRYRALLAEPLERRDLLAVYTITCGSTFRLQCEDGEFNLAKAIQESNKSEGVVDTIEFALGGLEPHRLPINALRIVDPVVIDGTTQMTDDGRPAVVLENGGFGGGLYLEAGRSTVKGLTITTANIDAGGFVGLVIEGGGRNVIQGNFIGLNFDGLTSPTPSPAASHFLETGIWIKGSNNNTIGGTTPAERNVISGNRHGAIAIEGSIGNVIQGNYIGTDYSGFNPVPNGDGIQLVGSTLTTIGGTEGITVGGSCTGACNLITGNSDQAIHIERGGGHKIYGNFIGPLPNGLGMIGNGGIGVSISDSINNVIGGTSPEARNIIGGNTVGITLFDGTSHTTIQGNHIGADPPGTRRMQNLVGIRLTGADNNTIGGTIASLGNLISGNTFEGVQLDASNDNRIWENRIGTDASGMQELGNGTGVSMTRGSKANQLSHNVISGNREQGVQILGSDANELLSNHIGVDLSGSQPLGNLGNGVLIEDSSLNTLGYSTSGQGNTISSNRARGVVIRGELATNNELHNNFIGSNRNDATNLGNAQDGLLIDGARFNHIGSDTSSNLIAGNGGSGILIAGMTARRNTLERNLIGSSREGTAIPNQKAGVMIIGGRETQVGFREGNVISGNLGSGIEMRSGTSLNTVVGNYIGINHAGSAALPNADGIVIDGSSANVIGGLRTEKCDMDCNVISGNWKYGVTVQGTAATGNIIQGNVIGSDPTITNRLGNTLAGIYLHNAPRNLIGGNDMELGNEIVANGTGIQISGSAATSNRVFRNWIGTNQEDSLILGNVFDGITISGASLNEIDKNVISGNGGNGIKISGSGAEVNQVTANLIGLGITIDSLPNQKNGVLISDGAFLNFVGTLDDKTVLCAPDVCNIISGNREAGVAVTNARQNVIAGNYIGTPFSRANGNKYGVVLSGVDGARVENNMINGNRGNGVAILGGNDAWVQGNRIGLGVFDRKLGNGGAGVFVYKTSAPVIGSMEDDIGCSTDVCNLIADNTNGVVVQESDAARVHGNIIWSHSLDGIQVNTSTNTLIASNQVRDNGRDGILVSTSPSTALATNQVQGNGRDGISVWSSGRATVTSSVVSDNKSIGIRCEDTQLILSATISSDNLTDFSFTNCNQGRPPGVSGASPTNSTVVEGMIEGSAGADYLLEVFVASTDDALAESLGSATITLGAEGVAAFREIFDADVPLGRKIFATTTGPGTSTSLPSRATPVTTLPPDDEVSINDVVVVEGDGGMRQMQFTVVRRNFTNADIHVRIDTADVSATADSGDYSPISGQVLTFPAGGAVIHTVSVPVAGDTRVEGDETFEVRLTNVQGAVIGKSIGMGTITDDDFAQLQAGDASLVEADDGHALLRFPVSLSRPVDAPVSVRLDTVDDTATSNDDYLPLVNDVVTFVPGEPLSQIVEVAVIGDQTSETDESFVLRLSDASGPNVRLGANGTGTILNNDLVRVSLLDARTIEGNSGPAGTLDFAVRLSNPADWPVTVDVATADDTAVESADYTAVPPTTLTFQPGGPLVQTVSVSVVGDVTVEPDETLLMRLDNVTGLNTLVTHTTAVGMIQNDDTATMRIDDVFRTEGTGNSTDFVFRVGLSAPSAEPITVRLHTEDGTATVADNDYVPIIQTTILFEPGQPLSQEVIVPVIADRQVESDESFMVVLSDAVGADVSIGDTQAMGTIRNDDATELSIDDVVLPEGDSGTTTFDFTISSSNPSDSDITVEVDLSRGSAGPGDYVAQAGRAVTLSAGTETFIYRVEIVGDIAHEPDEAFSVGLLNPSGSGVTIADAVGAGTIVDDDPDGDGDGLADTVEDLGPKEGDGDENGIADRTESDVASFVSRTGTAPATLILSAGDFSDFKLVVNNGDKPVGTELPLHTQQFLVTGIGAGQATTVTIPRASGTELDTYFWYGSIAGETEDRYHEFLYDGTTGAQFLADRVVVHLVDGGRGDQDESVDGVITTMLAGGDITGTDLAVETLSGPDPVGPNQQLTYTLVVTNHGPNAATLVTLSDQIPIDGEFVDAASAEGTIQQLDDQVVITWDSIPPGESRTSQISILTPAAPGLMTNRAVVSADEVELNPPDNTSNLDTMISVVGLVEGQKFVDTNGDGTRNAGEVGLDGFVIEIIDSATGTVVDSTVTTSRDVNADGTINPETERGLYSLAVLVDATYEVREPALAGFTQTFPGGETQPTTERASQTESAVGGNGSSQSASISSDGRFVAFQSAASNLVLNDTNDAADIFVVDRQAGTVQRVSVDSAGTQSSGGFFGNRFPAITPDGRFVVFVSDADNLVAGDTNAEQDIFVHDRQNGTTERVNLSAAETQANGPSGPVEFGTGPSISDDGNSIVFQSLATNLVAGDQNFALDIFVKSRDTGAIERVNVNDDGEETGRSQHSYNAVISGNGQVVAYVSAAANLVAGDTNQLADVFVFDRQSRTVVRATVDGDGGEADRGGDHPALNADGRFVAFDSFSTNLVPGDSNNTSDVFVFDRGLGGIERLSVAADGAQANGLFGAMRPAISDNGRYVAFDADADNLVPSDENNATDVFLVDRQSDSIERVSVDTSGNEASGPVQPVFSIVAAISGDGLSVAFESNTNNLVAGDTNGARDVFVHDLARVSGDRYTVTLGPGDRIVGRDFGNVPLASHDFGDAPDSYGTRLTDNGARHAVDFDGPILGAVIDVEPDAIPTAAANGDDQNGLAVTDEDGVVLASTLVAGLSHELTVIATADAMLDAWIDLDRDGIFQHPAEQVFQNESLVTGDNRLSITIPTFATPGSTYARFRLSSSGDLGPTGPASNGEIEDYPVEVVAFDFGDAPFPYPTRLAEDGARHRIDRRGPHLGSFPPDAETDGQPHFQVRGDDNPHDDEDGFTVLPMGGLDVPWILPGQPLAAQVAASGNGLVNVWIDLNQDFDWDDAGEHLVVDRAFSSGGPIDVSCDTCIPADTNPGLTVVRVRVSSVGGLGPIGVAPDGEVEDHLVHVAGYDAGDAPFDDLTFGTTLGARHVIQPGAPRLGTSLADADHLPLDTIGYSDDLTGFDDEDGVLGLGNPLVPGTTHTITIDVAAPATQAGLLNGWIDFDDDGDWNDPAERIFTDLPLDAGTHQLEFNVPAGMLPGTTTFARFRLSQVAGLGPSCLRVGCLAEGDVAAGEVEDYVVTSGSADIRIELDVEGASADTAGEVRLPAGSPASLAYRITNIGNVTIGNLSLVDDHGTPQNPSDDLTPSYSAGDQDGDGALGVGETWTFTAGTTVRQHDWMHTAAVTGEPLESDGSRSAGIPDVADSDRAGYFGVTAAIQLATRIQGIDADQAPGLLVLNGTSVQIGYTVVNPGNVPLAGVSVADDSGLIPEYASGDANANQLLDTGESWVYLAPATAVDGQSMAAGHVTGSDASLAIANRVTDHDVAYYFGVSPAIEVHATLQTPPSNPQDEPRFAVGSEVSFEYHVANRGNVPLDHVVFADLSTQPLLAGGDTNGNQQLDLTEQWIFVDTGHRVDVDDQAKHVAVQGHDATQTAPVPVTDQDSTPYFGVSPKIHIETLTNSEDADYSAGPLVPADELVRFQYVVTNIGNVALAGVAVYDDQDVDVIFDGGDTNANELLDLDETWMFSGERTSQPGRYANTGTAQGEDASSTRIGLVFDSDPSHHQVVGSTASISGWVYADVNNNGIRESHETGLPNVPVVLSGPVFATTVTDAGGQYRFVDLPPGVYTISETQPAAFMDGVDTAGIPNLGLVENDRFEQMSLDAGVHATNYNFGERGLHATWVSKSLYLASTPTDGEWVQQMSDLDGWYIVGAESEGELQVRLDEIQTIEVYTPDMLPAMITEESSLSMPMAAGDTLLVLVAGHDLSGAAVRVRSARPSMYSNPDNALDATGDGAVTPIDVLVVVNELNRGGPRSLTGARHDAVFFDVNADSHLTPIDALMIINALNARAAGEGESPGATEDTRRPEYGLRWALNANLVDDALVIPLVSSRMQAETDESERWLNLTKKPAKRMRAAHVDFAELLQPHTHSAPCSVEQRIERDRWFHGLGSADEAAALEWVMRKDGNGVS